MFPFSLNNLSMGFLKNDILSIDIGFTNIKVVHVRKRAGDLIRIVNFGIGNTPKGCMKNGIINNLDGIAINLRKMIEDNHINEKNVKLVISAGSDIISKVIFVEKVNDRIIERKISEEISKQIPVDISSQKLFFRITGEIEKENILFYKVLVTVVPNSMIENYIRLLKLLKFKPVSIEIPFSSVARFFSKGVSLSTKDNINSNNTPIDVSKGATAIIDLGSETTNLSVLNKGALEFNRIILVGGRVLDENISNTLKISGEMAERYKKMHGITVQRNNADDIERIVNICIRDYLGEVLNHVKKSIEFYVNRYGGQPLERIFFIGGGSALKGLKGFAQEILGKPVYTVESMAFGNVEFEGNLDKDKIRFLINALGLAM